MSFREKKRDRQLQTELLKIQLKHERLVVFYSAAIATGAAFLVFAITFSLTAHLLMEKNIPLLWDLVTNVLATLAGIVVFVSLWQLFHLKSAIEEQIESIREKYSEEF